MATAPFDPEEPGCTDKIFVGGLPTNADAEALRACFACYGSIADVSVMFDRRTKRSRGFGFVRFAHGARGANAVKRILRDAADHKIAGKWIEVKHATPAALLRDEASQEESSEGEGVGGDHPSKSVSLKTLKFKLRLLRVNKAKERDNTSMMSPPPADSESQYTPLLTPMQTPSFGPQSFDDLDSMAGWSDQQLQSPALSNATLLPGGCPTCSTAAGAVQKPAVSSSSKPVRRGRRSRRVGQQQRNKMSDDFFSDPEEEVADAFDFLPPGGFPVSSDHHPRSATPQQQHHHQSCFDDWAAAHVGDDETGINTATSATSALRWNSDIRNMLSSWDCFNEQQQPALQEQQQEQPQLLPRLRRSSSALRHGVPAAGRAAAMEKSSAVRASTAEFRAATAELAAMAASRPTVAPVCGNSQKMAGRAKAACGTKAGSLFCPPPGLQSEDSSMAMSPMKVMCRPAYCQGVMTEDGNERLDAFTREEFVSLKLRPWLSAW